MNLVKILQTLRHIALSTSIAIFFVSLTLYGQVTGGTIAGSVHDAGGALVSGADISIRNLSTGIVHTVRTNEVGYYLVPNLLPGSYELTINATGFAPSISKGISLTVGSQLTVNVALQIGKATESVQVNAATGVDLATSTLSGEIDGTAIRELPLNGRDWTQLATLEPGVNEVRNQSPVGGVGSADVSRGARGFGNQLSVAGTRPTQNNYRLDGISFNDYTNGAPGSVLGPLAGVDAIAEFSVLTANYTSEYGKTSGGVINAVTKSGTNQFHGDAYEFIRNSALDARNYFDGVSIPPFKRNQFGVSVGGPIIKDKTFFFFNYEGLRQSLSSTNVNIVPSNDARNGIYYTQNADGSISSQNIGVDPQVAPYLNFWHVPNGSILSPGNTAIYTVVTNQNGTDNFYTGRITHHFSSHDSLGVTGLYDTSFLTNPDPLNNIGFSNSNSRPFGSLEETHIFTPDLVNSFRLGFSRNLASIATSPAINPLAADTSLGAVPGQPAPFISVPGIAGFFGGLDGFPNFSFGWNSYQLYDDAFYTRGKHSFKFGFATEYMQSNNLFHFFDNGNFSFGSLQDFLTNVPQSFSGNEPSTDSPRNIRETLFGGYIQDDWRALSNLTLNLGLRYEMTTIPTETHGKLATLRTMTDTQVHTGNPYFNNPTLKNFEPRVGFAWNVFGNGMTSVRSGFGLFDVLPLPYEFLIISSASAPFLQSVTAPSTQLVQGDFPYKAYQKGLAAQSPGSLAGQRVAYVDPNPQRSYVAEWNLSVQQELPGKVVATLGYVGSRGLHLPYRTDDADIVIPTLQNGTYYFPQPTASGTQINPNVGRIDRLATDADSYYHGMLVGVEKKLSHGVQVQGSYTWQKSIDTGSSTIAGDQFSNSPTSLPFWFDPRSRRGQSDFNLEQDAVISTTYELPVFVRDANALGYIVDGWQVGGIFQASSGSPFPVLIGGDLLGLNNTDPYDYPDKVNGPACSSLVNPRNPNNYINLNCFAVPAQTNRLGTAGRNPLTGPGLSNLDASIFKNTRIQKISETANIQFRAEAFNLLNRANFAAPLQNNTLFAQDGPNHASPVGGAGVINSTQTPSRQIQFGLKLIW
ncbi:MAG: TonB-dependent receptor [Acidobacteria bacterium]|nr:TonB-dependent receptor [Acidobacteriota bacterium]